MNIGIFTDTYYPEINGVANSSYELKKGLEKMGHKVYVFTVTNPNAEELEEDVFRMASIPFLFLKERRVAYPLIQKWRRKIESLHLDVIHTQTEFGMGHFGRKAAEYMNIPHVHTYHTIYEDYMHYIKLPGNSRTREIAREFTRHCCKYADVVIVPTEKVRTLLKSYHIDKNIRVIPTGIKLDKFFTADEDKVSTLKRKYNIEDKLVLIYIGRISKEKNLHEIIRHFYEIQNEDTQVKLVIVGDGPELDELKRQSVELKLEDKVIFTGAVPWSEIQDYYAMGDIFVSASTSETQGLTYAEALASGLPILVRRDECLKGILSPMKNDMDYNEQDEFLHGYHYLAGKIHEKNLKEEIRESIHFLAVDTFAENVEKVYQGLVG